MTGGMPMGKAQQMKDLRAACEFISRITTLQHRFRTSPNERAGRYIEKGNGTITPPEITSRGAHCFDNLLNGNLIKSYPSSTSRDMIRRKRSQAVDSSSAEIGEILSNLP